MSLFESESEHWRKVGMGVDDLRLTTLMLILMLTRSLSNTSKTVMKPRPQRREARASLKFLVPRTVCFLHFSHPHSRQIPLFTSDHPPTLTYNQSRSELISPTRLALPSGLETEMILLIAPSHSCILATIDRVEGFCNTHSPENSRGEATMRYYGGD